MPRPCESLVVSALLPLLPLLLLLLLPLLQTCRANDEQFPGPSDPGSEASLAAWLKQWRGWRAATRKADGYTGAIYNVTALEWTQTAYIQPQMHPYDQYFYDVQTHNYTVDRFLQDVGDRYGGIDALLMWPTYTNIGIDDRSQFDLFSAMPGGLEAVRAVVDQLHSSGVKVMLPYNPWDTGTRRDAQGRDDATLLDTLITAVDADGFNGDTMGVIPEEFFTVSVNLSHPVALEPELGGDDQSAAWDTMGWGYYQYPQLVSVDRWKWLDPRRLTNICKRWSKDHTNALQYALFNGDGFESWENVWGTWNGITPRDGEAIRRVGALSRFLGGRGYLQSQQWIPHVITTAPGMLFASQWPLAGSVAWTVVNRGTNNHTGPALVLPTTTTSYRYFDLYMGKEIMPVTEAKSGSSHTLAQTLALDVEVGGFGAVLGISGPLDANLTSFLATMANMTAVPLSRLDSTWRYQLQRRARVFPTKPYSSAPAGMVSVPGGQYLFKVSGVEIEGSGSSIADNPFGVDVQYEWEARPNRFHEQAMTMDSFYMDKFPVTQQQFHKYLSSTPIAIPSDTYNYLKNWDWGPATRDHRASSFPTPRPHNVNVPVTFIGLDEARAYCRSVGKRLPRSEEWQYAGQGGDASRVYPWGNTNTQSMYPVLQGGTTVPGPLNVTAFSPMADSPFGVADMIGNVWQYTDEFSDDHTRSVVVRGGSNYRPQGSHWYFPQAATLTQHNKYFLMDARYERAATLGFRCVADAVKRPCAEGLCLRLDPPAAYTDLDTVGVDGWMAWANSSSITPTARAGSTARTIDIAMANTSAACSGSQVAVSWSGGNGSTPVMANSSAAVCNAGTLTFNVSLASIGEHAIRVFAGAAHGMLASGALIDVNGHTVANVSQSFSPNGTSGTKMNVAWTFRVPSSTAGSHVRVSLQPLAAPLPPLPPCAQGMCMVLVDEGTTATDVSLSDEGRTDWVHFGLAGPQSVDRMKGSRSAALIGTLATVGGGGKERYSNSAATFSWVDGTPTSTADKTPTGVYNAGLAAGYTIDVAIPTSKIDVIVKAYVGIYNSAGVLTATLLDAKGAILAAVNDSSLVGPQQNAFYRVAVPPSTAQAPRTLRLSWVQATAGGNINIQGLTVDASAWCEGSMCGRREGGPRTVDLSERGTMDWAHWGSSSSDVTAADTRDGPTSLIGAVKGMGGAVRRYDNNPTTFTWDNGRPSKVVVKAATGIFVAGKDQALSTTVNIPSTNAAVVVFVYVGLYGSEASGMFNATLTGGGGEAAIGAAFTSNAGNAVSNAVYEVGIAPAAIARTLSLRWTQISAGDTNIELQAVAVQGGSTGLNSHDTNSPIVMLQAIALHAE